MEYHFYLPVGLGGDLPLGYAEVSVFDFVKMVKRMRRYHCREHLGIEVYCYFPGKEWQVKSYFLRSYPEPFNFMYHYDD